MIDTYFVEDYKFQQEEINGSKVDGHCHSRFSNEYIQPSITKFLGVKECYTPIWLVNYMLNKRGMNFKTLMDHDVVKGALIQRRKRWRKGFNDAWVNCEYNVTVEPGKHDQLIHAGVWGLDYPGSITKPLSDKEVMELHQELLNEAGNGAERFVDYCMRQVKVGVDVNHLAQICTPKNPISGRQLEELADLFPVLEVNGDCQGENITLIEIAERKNKPICAGTDAHTYLRLGNQYTVAWNIDPLTGEKIPVKTPAEYLQAFKAGRIGIGSRFKLPEDIAEPSIEDIVKHQFNGTISKLQKDTGIGVASFFTLDWGWKKWRALGLLFGIPVFLCYLQPEWAIPTILMIEGGLFTFTPTGLPPYERLKVERRTEKLQISHNKHLSDMETSLLREERGKLTRELNSYTKLPPDSEITSLEEKLETIKGKIKIIEDKYKELPQSLNPTLKGLTRWGYKVMNALKFLGRYDTTTNSQFTKPIEKKKED